MRPHWSGSRVCGGKGHRAQGRWGGWIHLRGIWRACWLGLGKLWQCTEVTVFQSPLPLCFPGLWCESLLCRCMIICPYRVLTACQALCEEP